jgi:hypothetical protein
VGVADRGLPGFAIKIGTSLCSVQLNVVIHRVEGEELAATLNWTLGVG